MPCAANRTRPRTAPGPSTVQQGLDRSLTLAARFGFGPLRELFPSRDRQGAVPVRGLSLSRDRQGAVPVRELFLSRDRVPPGRGAVRVPQTERYCAYPPGRQRFRLGRQTTPCLPCAANSPWLRVPQQAEPHETRPQSRIRALISPIYGLFPRAARPSYRLTDKTTPSGDEASPTVTFSG